MQKTLLVTGASTGLGLSVAIKAAKDGHKVYASMRNLDKRSALDEAVQEAGVDIPVLHLDVQDNESIEKAVADIIAAEGRLDVLVANAGVGFVRTTEHAEFEDIDWLFDTNVTGVIRCVKAVLPHMREARSGHVIAITSVGGLVGQPFNELYCSTKFAVEGYLEGLASYVGPAFNIDFSLVEPGGIQSEFANSVLAHFQKTGGMIEDDYLPILQKYLGLAQARLTDGDREGVYQTADEVASVVIDVMAQEHPPLRTRTSPWSEAFSELKTQVDPDGRKLQAKVIEQLLGGLAPR